LHYPFAVGRRLVVVLFACALGLLAAGRASAFTKQGLSLRMDDGVTLAATLYEPSAAPPPAGFQAIVMFHGLGGKRQDLDFLAQQFAGSYAVLTFDARGHGQSDGLVSIDGPREIADTRAVFGGLAARPEINRNKIGAWGLSLGGGAVLRSLVEGVPWAAVEVLQTWTDLYQALAPQGLAKSGAIFQFLSSVPQSRLDPSVLAIRDDAIASKNLASLNAFAKARSSRPLLSKVTTPVMMFQGRRDFAFDIGQATAGYRLLKGPKRLYIGDFGHSPSTFPGPDIAQVVAQGAAWFGRYLQGVPLTTTPVALAPNPWRGKVRAYTGLPPTRRLSLELDGRDTITGAGKVVRKGRPLTGMVETFGSAEVRVTARLGGGWSHLVAALTAKPPRGNEVVVSEGGLNTSGLSGTHRLTIRLLDDATLIRRRSRLRLTLASNSLAQSPANLLYLDLPMPGAARVTLGSVRLVLPVLKTPISVVR
jgi:predicted acyl esterase